MCDTASSSRPARLVAALGHQLGQPEVEQLDDRCVGGSTAPREDDVRRLQIAVQDAAAVRRLEGAHDERHDFVRTTLGARLQRHAGER
jgi:hypothetical protein